MTHKKKLIEVALPLEAINAACKLDKDRKTGTIRNIHKWFAAMPLPALRAMIFAALVDAPTDEQDLQELLGVITRLVESGHESPPPHVLAEARRAIKSSVGDDAPTVFDPFCGGGSTLVEAQRLGLPAQGSDLNPIPVLITKALTEIPPTVRGHRRLHSDANALDTGTEGPVSGFLDDVRHYAGWIYSEAQERIGRHYPAGPDGEPVLGWWWARTVESPDPRFQGLHTPLVSSWWLSKHKSNKAWVRADIGPSGQLQYSIESKGAPPSTAKKTCLYSGAPISFEYIRQQGQSRLGMHLLSIVTHGTHGRRYHAPEKPHVDAASAAVPNDPPTVRLPDAALGFRIQKYDMNEWADLFSDRQKLSLETFASLVADIPARVVDDGGSAAYGEAISTVLGLVVGKLAQSSSVLTRWFIDSRNGSGGPMSAFATQTISMSWDFVETNPFSGSVGDWMKTVETSLRSFDHVAADQLPARVFQSDARSAAEHLSDRALIVTDPPYFAAIGYADLSDYFYIWIRKALRGVYPDIMATISTPKSNELIAAPNRHESPEDAKRYFVEGFTETFASLKNASCADLPILVVYAYKEDDSGRGGRVSSGWEAMLDALVQAGLSVVGTWPIWGSRSTRMRGNASNALATYVVLVCRRRSEAAGRTTRRDIVGELRNALDEAVPLLQSTAIAPLDLSQAVIGPGMAVFSKYSAVLEPDGSRMSVREALLLINRVLSEVIEEQEGDLDADSRWAVTWFEQHAFNHGTFGDADALARAKVTSVEGLMRAGILQQLQGKVRLLGRNELPENYNPASDSRPTSWEAVQHLAKRLQSGGEIAAAEFLRLLGAHADAAQILTYRLYQACMKQGWSEEGLVYNELMASWSEIARLSKESSTRNLF